MSLPSNKLDEEFQVKVNVHQGPGVLKELPSYLLEQGLVRPALVVDKNVKNLRPVRDLLESITKHESFESTVLMYDLPFEPTYESLEQQRRKFINQGTPNVDVFIGIGGGSTMDFCKGLAILATNLGPALQYRGFPTGLNPSLPIVTVPTVAGSAAEITYNAVFIEEATGTKLGINTRHNYPLISFVDLDIASLCPVAVTLSSGMDALVHTIEGFASKKCGGLSRALFISAFKVLYHYLPKVLANPENVSYRGEMFVGSHLAGLALQNAGSGPSGAMSYPLGAKYSVPHGLAGGMTLAHVVEHNVTQGYDGYADLYQTVLGNKYALSRKEMSQKFAQMLFELYRTCNVPQNLSRYGIYKDDLPNFLDLFQDSSFDQNPVPFGKADIKRIIARLL